MNSCSFIGRLAADPELKTVNGKSVVKFRLAINNGKDAVFADFEAWDTAADHIVKYYKKGKPIWVNASLRQEEWTDKASGQKRTKHSFRVNRFGFVPTDSTAGRSEDAAPTNKTEAAGGDAPADGEDIPF